MAHYHNEKFKEMARDTLDIFDNQYLQMDMDVSIDGTHLYRPEDELVEPDGEVNVNRTLNENVNITVIESTSTDAAYDMYDKYDSACVLNFASANKAGGGFKNGSVAQEESLARVSGLYYSLMKYKEIYNGEWSQGEYYQNYYVYSPYVPFIKEDDGSQMETKFISVISSAAVNRNNFNTLSEDIENTIKQVMCLRIDDIFKIAIKRDERNIVLGAYGCGVFKNDSKDVALYFKDSLKKYSKYFDNITFAIYDTTPNKEVLTNFQNII